MIKELISIANQLDKMGRYAEADMCTRVAQRLVKLSDIVKCACGRPATRELQVESKEIPLGNMQPSLYGTSFICDSDDCLKSELMGMRDAYGISFGENGNAKHSLRKIHNSY